MPTVCRGAWVPAAGVPAPCSNQFRRRWPRACYGGWRTGPALSPRRTSVSTLNKRITWWAPCPGTTSYSFWTGLMPSPWRLSVHRGTWLVQHDGWRIRRAEEPTDGRGGATPNRLCTCCRKASCMAFKAWTSCALSDDGGGPADLWWIAMGREPGADDSRGISDATWRSLMLPWELVKSRWGIAGTTASGSHRGMGWGVGTAGMDEDHWSNGIIWTGKDVGCGESQWTACPPSLVSHWKRP